MRPTSRFFQNWLRSVLVTLLALAASVLPARAAAQTFTLHLSDVTEVILINNPCFGRATGTLTYDAVVHVTENKNSYHTTVHMRGESVTVPDDPSLPTFSGRFNETQVLNLNRNNANSQFVVTQRTHGLLFHITFHITVTPGGGELTVFNVTCAR